MSVNKKIIEKIQLKKTYRYDKQSNKLTNVWNSVMKISEKLDINYGEIYNRLLKRNEVPSNFIWSYNKY